MEDSNRRSRAFRIEAALWITMGALAFLARDNPRLAEAGALPLFAVLLLSSLATSVAVRLCPGRRLAHAATIVLGYAAVATLQIRTGGTESTLWVLYFLPLFSSAILLEDREAAWVSFGACAVNAALYALSPEPWSASASFELTLKTAVLAGAAAATWALARAERDAERVAGTRRAEIGRLEQSLREIARTREEESGLAAIAAVGAGAVHDLTTPLMVVRAYARMNLERGLDDPALTRDLERIAAAAAFCQELVAGLLVRDAGTPVARRVTEIVETALSLAEPVLQERRVAIVRAYPEEEMSWRASRQDLERIVLNLISNAAKAMPGGGTVAVRVRRDASGPCPCALVCVEDDGPGIPPEILPRLFQAFATTRAGNGGTGLGLYISREVARRHGGSLDAENRPEGGARFVLRLPLLAACAPQPRLLHA